MLKSVKVLLPLIFMILLKFAQATPILGASACLNDANSNNVALQKSFNQCWEPLGMSYIVYATGTGKVAPVTQAQVNSCFSENVLGQKMDLTQMASYLNEEGSFVHTLPEHLKRYDKDLGFFPATDTPPPNKSDMIKKECIVAAMKRNPGNKGYVCDYEGKSGENASKQIVPKYYGKASGRTAQCVDQGMTDYIHYAVNSAIQCLSGVGKVDSKTVFRKINNESAFNISVASNGGVGMAQLTSIAVKEMYDKSLGKGRYVLEHIAKSMDSSCSGFKDVAAQDLKKAPSTSAADRCMWLSPGDGLARNLMYSIGYYLTMRDKYLAPILSRQAPNLVKDEGLMNDLTSIAYGAEGISHARGLLKKFRVNNKTNLVELRKKIRANSVYLGAIKSKMKEVTCIRKGWQNESKECKKYEIEPAELEGETCVAPI